MLDIFDVLPQEILEAILIVLVKDLPVRRSVHLRSINRWFRDTFDYLLFQQKYLLKRFEEIPWSDELSNARLGQHLYNLQGVISIPLAIELVNHEWTNPDFMPATIRIVFDEVENRILKLENRACKHKLPPTEEDRLTVRADLRELLVRWNFIHEAAEGPAGALRRFEKLLRRSPDFEEISSLLSEPTGPQALTKPQSWLLDREAATLTSALSDPKFLQSTKNKVLVPSFLFWHTQDTGYLNEGAIPLELAAECGRAENLKLLLRRPRLSHIQADMHERMYSSLCSVARNGDVEAAQVLIDAYLKKGYTVAHYRNQERHSPFITACGSNHLGVAQLMEQLLPHSYSGRITGSCIHIALRLSSAKGVHSRILRYLVRLGASTERFDIDETRMNDEFRNGHSPLMHAVYFGHKHTVRTLLDLGSDLHHLPRAGNCYWPVYWGDVDMLRLLSDSGIDLHQEFPLDDVFIWREAILVDACELDRLEVVRFMLDRYPEIVDSEHARIGMKRAIQRHRTDIVRLLIDRGFKVKDSSVSEVIFYAADWQNTDVLRILIDAGADVNQPFKDYEGINKLPLVAAEGRRRHSRFSTALSRTKENLRSREEEVSEDERARLEEICSMLRAAGGISRSSEWVADNFDDETIPEIFDEE